MSTSSTHGTLDAIRWDLTSCEPCEGYQVMIVVVPVIVTHLSPGLVAISEQRTVRMNYEVYRPCHES